MKRVTANGIDVAYLEAGPPGGPLVVCLHGFPDHAPTFGRLLADLADAGFHAVAPWLRGYAPSGVPADGRYGSDALGADAIALADALGGEDVCLVGHDWGAGATYVAATKAPERFRKIVTLAVPHTSGMTATFFNPRQIQRSFYMFFFQLPIAEMAVLANDLAFIDYLWARWSPRYTPDPAFMRSLKDTLAASLDAAIGNYRAIFSGGGGFGDATIGVPALYMHGADDDCLGLDAVDLDAMRPSFTAGLDVEIVDGAGHFLHLERPAVVNERIVSFLTA